MKLQNTRWLHSWMLIRFKNRLNLLYHKQPCCSQLAKILEIIWWDFDARWSAPNDHYCLHLLYPPPIYSVCTHRVVIGLGTKSRVWFGFWLGLGWILVGFCRVWVRFGRVPFLGFGYQKVWLFTSGVGFQVFGHPNPSLTLEHCKWPLQLPAAKMNLMPVLAHSVLSLKKE